MQSGRLESALAGVLRIRSSTAARQITQKHRVVVDGVTYGIRSNANPDQRNDMLEFSVEVAWSRPQAGVCDGQRQAKKKKKKKKKKKFLGREALTKKAAGNRSRGREGTRRKAH